MLITEKKEEGIARVRGVKLKISADSNEGS